MTPHSSPHLLDSRPSPALARPSSSAHTRPSLLRTHPKKIRLLSIWPTVGLSFDLQGDPEYPPGTHLLAGTSFSLPGLARSHPSWVRILACQQYISHASAHPHPLILRPSVYCDPCTMTKEKLRAFIDSNATRGLFCSGNQSSALQTRRCVFSSINFENVVGLVRCFGLVLFVRFSRGMESMHM